MKTYMCCVCSTASKESFTVELLLWVASLTCTLYTLQVLTEGSLTANEWVKAVAPVIGGKGGGSNVSAQASGPLINKIQEAIQAAREFASSKTN